MKFFSSPPSGKLKFVSLERRAESREQRFGIFGIIFDRKWVYYRGFRGYDENHLVKWELNSVEKIRVDVSTRWAQYCAHMRS